MRGLGGANGRSPPGYGVCSLLTWTDLATRGVVDWRLTKTSIHARAAPLPLDLCVVKRSERRCVLEGRGEGVTLGDKSQNQGLISVDRSNKATLLLTIPRSIFKSSAKDLSPPIFEIVISYDTGRS